MPDIVVTHSHNMNHTDARNLATELASELATKHHLSHHWEADTIHFEGIGVHGQIEVDASNISISAELGWLVKPLRGVIEKEISAVLNSHFS
ncbi:MAG: polyhydroxyalkanoic acid system family protein [Gammaproteobacteria bacterium]|jgi:putative polyhydroxyalkanoate system protein|nr:polyhydroxyalkanoic acid system family protein [Gammaproteobacteria bacterium]